eukprot:6470759-Amphidinium_carterae.3
MHRKRAIDLSTHSQEEDIWTTHEPPLQCEGERVECISASVTLREASGPSLWAPATRATSSGLSASYRSVPPPPCERENFQRRLLPSRFKEHMAYLQWFV